MHPLPHERAFSLEGIASLTIDYEHDELRVLTRDGRVVVQEGGARRTPGPLDFKSSTYKPDDLTLELVGPADEKFEIEVFANDDTSRLAGRPIIYLDQNKWVLLAQAMHRQEKVPGSELKSALRLIELAQSKKLVLPISSGHVIETGPTEGRWRTHVATLMVALSRGWIMSDPQLVAHAELSTLFQKGPGNPGGEGGVVTLDARRLYADPLPPYVPKDPGLAPEAVRMINALTRVQATLAVLLENEKTQDSKGTEMARRWAELHEELAQRMARSQVSRSTRRRLSLEAFVLDLGHGLEDAARAHGLTRSQLMAWKDSTADEDIDKLKYLGRRRDVMHARLSSADDHWHGHDLVDMVYLPCAAEFADYVVCEKKTADYLQRVARERKGAVVVKSISDVLALLDVG